MTPTSHSPRSAVHAVRAVGSGVEGFLAGVGDVWRGAGFLLTRPALWIWAILPFVINLALFAGVAWVGWHYYAQWVAHLESAAGAHWWSAAIGGVLAILFWLLFALLMVFCFVPLASLIAAPFNDVLSEKVERIYAGAGIDQPFSVALIWQSLRVGLMTGLRLSFKTILLMLIALPLYLIPVIGGVLGPAAQAAITIRFLALQHTAYSMDRRIYTYRQKDQFLRANRGRTIGMGAMSFLAMMIPGVNALFIPISAVAGTLLFCDTELGRAEAES